MGINSGILGVLPMLAGDKQVKNLAKSGMLGIAPSLMAKDMGEQDRLEKIQTLKEIEELKKVKALKQQAALAGDADGVQTTSDKGMKRGGTVSSASSRADGCATKGKTKGRFV
jgi:hypothetical protein